MYGLGHMYTKELNRESGPGWERASLGRIFTEQR